jgi:4-hydroxybenzoate polyprenyltransferase
LTPSEIAAQTLRPLCVDLDGTLVKSDTLVDSLLVLARSRPALLLKLPGRLLHGKAAFKALVAESITLDVTHLPYNRKVLELLEEEHRKGRAIYLTTGANEGLAQRIAEHLDLFTAVLGSDSSNNLTANRKLESVRSRLGDEFDYIGNDTPDLPLLAAAAETMVANPTLRLRAKLRASGIRPVRELDERASTIRSILKAMRPHQWIKNLLIVLPLVLAHMLRFDQILAGFIAICCFSLTSSSVYILNDLLDIEVDRRHPRKRFRPFASGELSAATALVLVAAFLAIAFGVAGLLLPMAFTAWLLVYLMTTMAYSSFLKRIALIDVLVLAGLYTMRLLAGKSATGTHISPWLAGFSVFLFFSLAIAKRFAELENLRSSGSAPQNDRGYFVADLDQLRTFGTASAFAAVIVFANYISGSDVTALYHHAVRLWLIMPFMILWLCRVWLLASRGTLNEDPVVFALTDRTSQLIGASVAIIAFLAV